MLDWQDIHIFAVLARTGSLSAAARELGVNHATVSRRIAALEHRLGLHLVERLPRRTRLTPHGQIVAEQAAPMERAAATITRHSRGARGPTTIRVSAPPVTAALVIAPRLAAFHARNPAIKVMLLGEAQTVRLDLGSADLALRMAEPADPDLVAKRVGTMDFGLYAAPALAALPHPERTFVAYEPTLDHLPQQAWLKSILEGRPIVFEASDLFAQREAVRAGLGAAALPRFMGDADPGLIRLPTPKPPPSRGLWLAHYPDLGQAAALRAVHALVAQTIAAVCPNKNMDLPGQPVHPDAR